VNWRTGSGRAPVGVMRAMISRAPASVCPSAPLPKEERTAQRRNQELAVFSHAGIVADCGEVWPENREAEACS